MKNFMLFFDEKEYGSQSTIQAKWKKKMKNFMFCFSTKKNMEVSQLYIACRNGELTKVKELLPQLTLDDIDREEPNQSTALHAASYYGHTDIVRLLLERGASRQQKNKFGNTPADEAKTIEIAYLFNRDALTPHNRFVANSVSREWSIQNEFAAASHCRRFYSYTERPPISTIVKKALGANVVQNKYEKEAITRLMKKATRKDDVTSLIRSYTAETDFYRKLNGDLADLTITNENAHDPQWSWAFARYIAADPELRQLQYAGTTYRGMHMTDADIAVYSVGKMLMNKAFLSTSKLRTVAEGFALKDLPSNKKAAVCTYIIKDKHATLFIKEFSEYPEEEEVLIMPCMDFQVTKLETTGKFIEIEVLLP